MSVIDEIAAERRRQVEQEGFSAGHDDKHRYGELAAAAGSYAIHAAGISDRKRAKGEKLPAFVPRHWPWEYRYWWPTTPRRDLIKAAALIVAEIERLDRAAERETPR